MASPLVKSPRNLVSGLFLLLLAGVAIWSLGSLPMGSLRVIGPAMLPKSVAVLIAVGGLALVLLGLLRPGEPLERWQFRGPLCVLAGLLLFAATIRMPGFLIAAPLACLVSGFGSHEVRPRELAIFTLVMTVSCILLFRVLLGQAIPILVIPGTPIRF